MKKIEFDGTAKSAAEIIDHMATFLVEHSQKAMLSNSKCTMGHIEMAKSEKSDFGHEIVCVYDALDRSRIVNTVCILKPKNFLRHDKLFKINMGDSFEISEKGFAIIEQKEGEEPLIHLKAEVLTD